MVAMAIEVLILAACHEILARSSWNLDPRLPHFHAAAAGVIAYKKTRDVQTMAFAALVAPIGGYIALKYAV